jgi:hypothetical protein
MPSDFDKKQADRFVAEMIIEYLMHYPSAESISHGLSLYGKNFNSNPKSEYYNFHVTYTKKLLKVLLN